MLLLKNIKKFFFAKSIVSLISLTLIILFLLVATLLFGHGYYLSQIEQVNAAEELESKKMQINSELMEIARARTRLTSQIIDTSDPFAQDELNIELENHAGRFAYLREQLLKLDLNEYEKQILEHEHADIVSTILPAQRKVVELATSGNPDELQKAQALLYSVVMPGQGRMIDSFGELIASEQNRISELTNSSRVSINAIKQKSKYLTGIVLSGVLALSIIVISRVRQIQIELFNSNKYLERTVAERTNELHDAMDELHRYVDIVDNHIISSHTDLKGNITYASDAFCRVSQYSQKELIDQPHSIVRHPDMPSIIYEDLWETISAGKSWRGDIKNRAKNGSAYWVEMNIDPMFNGNGEIIGYAATSQDISDKKHIEGLSVTDTLTQLYNRLKLDKAIAYEIERSRRYHNPLSIVMFDIDDFKSVNDTYGHQVGDSVLVNIADIVHDIVREADIAGRWGGEEFMIICPDTDIDGAVRLAEKLRKAIAENRFTAVGNKTCSFGATMLRLEEDADSFINRADNALYQAKREGRNRVVVSS